MQLLLIWVFAAGGCAYHDSLVLPISQSQDPVNVHTISDGLSTAYLIETTSGLLLVDTGNKSNESNILKKMNEIDRSDLKLIYITHAHLDHYGCADSLRQKTGAKIAIHKDDADAMAAGKTNLGQVKSWGLVGKFLLPVGNLLWRPDKPTADILLIDRDHFDNFGFNAVVVHTPGHTPGSTSLIVNNQYAFTGDLIISRISLHKQQYFADNWNQIDQSLARLKQINPEWIFPGHGKPIPGSDLHSIK
ncbi:MAG: MBL fold metallo-hydrolase [Planctomycetes bacterium]|nr:MBL fold metallo-hydrolase [Planctomycetota bacterium]